MSDFQKENKSTQTPLGQIMDLLYINGSDLAHRAHIDRTMVSRWKNGRLEFSMKSSCFEDIVNVILDINESQNLEILELFFKSVYHREIESRKDLHRCVVAWLLSKDYNMVFNTIETEDGGRRNFLDSSFIPKQGIISTSDRDLSKPSFLSVKDNALSDQDLSASEKQDVCRLATYSIYEGDAGREEAFLQLREVFSSLSDDDRLWGYDMGINPFWGYVMAGLSMHTQNKPELITFHFLGRPTDEIFSMFSNCLPCFFYAKSIAYCTYDKPSLLYDYMYSMKGTTVVTGDYDEKKKGLLYTSVHDDPVMVRAADEFLGKFSHNFRPWLTRIYDWKMDAEYMKPESGNVKNIQYVFIEDIISFTLGFVQEPSLLQISGVTDFQADYILAYCKGSYALLRTFLDSGAVRFVISYESLLKLREKPESTLSAFTGILEREINIPSKLILGQLINFIRKASSFSNVQIALRPPNSRSFLVSCNVWLREDDKAYFFSERDASYRLMTDEYSTIQALFQYCSHFWDILPGICTKTDWILRKLENL